METKTYFCNDPNDLIYFISWYFMNEIKPNFSQLNVTILVILSSGNKANDFLLYVKSDLNHFSFKHLNVYNTE